MNENAMSNTSKTDWTRVDAMNDENIDTSDLKQEITMIIDNINTKLDDDIKSEFLQFTDDFNPCISACICTGYFTLWGWEKLKNLFSGDSDSFSQHWDAKLIIGMESKKEKIIQSFNNAKNDNEKKLAKSFKEAIRTGGMQVKYHLEGRIHAKMYAFDFNTSRTAYVGSSNFTKNGLTSNMELMLKIKEESRIKELKNWFNDLWYTQKLIDISDEIAWGSETYYDASLLDFSMIQEYCFAVDDFKVYTKISNEKKFFDLYDNSKCYRAKDYYNDCDGLNRTLLSKLIKEYGLQNLYLNDDVEFRDFYLAEHLDLAGMDLLDAAKFCKKSANYTYIDERKRILYELMDEYINDYD
jgi:hypothetical protein